MNTNAIVAPLVGAWIEITGSRTDWYTHWVAPLVGAWIEMCIIMLTNEQKAVAPLVGAWIEISSSIRWIVRVSGRSSCRSVD